MSQQLPDDDTPPLIQECPGSIFYLEQVNDNAVIIILHHPNREYRAFPAIPVNAQATKQHIVLY
jgi:hypothetical protein